MPNVREIMETWLKEHGYDGLTSGEDECVCSLLPADGCPLFTWCTSSQYVTSPFPDCYPGHRRVTGPGKEDWDIVAEEEVNDADR